MQTLLSALQLVPVMRAVLLHVPVAGLHTFLRQLVSTLPSLVTIVAGLSTHVCVLGWGINVPSHLSPFSKPALSAVVRHAQELTPPMQLPPKQPSPLVHALRSSQGAVLLACLQPLAGTQECNRVGGCALQSWRSASGKHLGVERTS